MVPVPSGRAIFRVMGVLFMAGLALGVLVGWLL